MKFFNLIGILFLLLIIPLNIYSTAIINLPDLTITNETISFNENETSATYSFHYSTNLSNIHNLEIQYRLNRVALGSEFFTGIREFRLENLTNDSFYNITIPEFFLFKDTPFSFVIVGYESTSSVNGVTVLSGTYGKYFSQTYISEIGKETLASKSSNLIHNFWTILGALVGGFLIFLTNYWVELIITIVLISLIVTLIKKRFIEFDFDFKR